jgi:hypothetical protein
MVMNDKVIIIKDFNIGKLKCKIKKLYYVPANLILPERNISLNFTVLKKILA